MKSRDFTRENLNETSVPYAHAKIFEYLHGETERTEQSLLSSCGRRLLIALKVSCLSFDVTFSVFWT